MELDKSAASPMPAYFGSILEICRRRDTTSSRVTCLTNLQMIGFGPFVAFRAGTRWGPVDIINQDVEAYSFKYANTEFRRVYSRFFRTCMSNLGHTGQFNVKAVITVLDQTINFNIQSFRRLGR